MDIDIEALIDLLDFKLSFSTTDGKFEGILKLLLVKRQRITFQHVCCLTPCNYVGTMHVKFCDLLSFEKLECSDAIIDVPKPDSVDKDLLDGDLEKKSQVDDSTIEDDTSVNDPKSFPEFLKNMCPSDYCVVESIDSVFLRSVQHISELDTIGVSFHGPELSRDGSLTWVCVSTPKCLFMFDIETMGLEAFHSGLQKVFEDESIEKVIHDCRQSADCVKHLFQTTIRNVFDTQVADFLINMQSCTDMEIFNNVNSLDSCLVKYLNLPQQFLHNRTKCASKDAEIEFFKERPISDEFKSVLVKSALYLLVLKEKQEKLLLHPFHQAVDVYLNILRDASEADVYRASNEFTQVAPSYLTDCIKIIRFYDLPVPFDDSVRQFTQALHGEEIKHCKKLVKDDGDQPE